jgi:threonine aldolase
MREIDLRSDTVTKPSVEMLEAMAVAKIGDDVFGEDPTVNELEKTSAEIMGKEDAVFVSSGTMGNLISVLAHAGRGDEIILGSQSHIFRSEAGGASALGGVSYHLLENDNKGMIDPLDVRNAIRDSRNHHYPRTALVTLENTQNNCGGKVLTSTDINMIADVAHEHGIPLHIDGARIFNAAVALKCDVIELVDSADTVSFCLSKGLSCPVGSVVCGSSDFIERARRIRKMVGGGTRQAGFIAAPGIVALQTMVSRLEEDHVNAKRLAIGLSEIAEINIDPSEIDTNLVFFDVCHGDRGEIVSKLENEGIKGGTSSKRWRFVTHYGITSGDIDYVLDVMKSVLVN